MRTYLTLLLDTRRTKKDGSYPIIFRLTHLRKTTSIATGFSISEIFWDHQKCAIKRTYSRTESIARLNTLLLKEEARANDILNKLADQGKLNYLSIVEVKKRITRNSNYESFFEFGYTVVEDLNASHRYGTARQYKCLLSVLRTFNKGRDLKFNEVNYSLIKRFEKHHLAKGNSWNGLSTYLRGIRALFNKGIKAGLIERDAYPFYYYTIRQVPTEKRALEVDDIRKIVALDIPKGLALFRYRNYFICSYFLYGMNFMDMAYLKANNIINGRVKFRRKKTGKLYDIKITDQLMEILDIYLKDKKGEDFIFPIIKREDPAKQEREINWERQRYNRGLKKIQELCGIEQKLTTYVSRHSFATQAMLHNIPLEAISAMLGHSKLNTTQIYLKSLPTTMLDDYNERLIEAI
ncbi:tyrosine-type recombinase/integrase [Flagellimonas olearia]|uniref:Tyrosine-type recombinase/integrase n=1 Tax=Flagellimonas olearia TaxID=552546 RepID=A0A6I1DXX3_9FLAO|nr:site-specific integrase [Allomuricauda olearia]KAB7530416.1 tyrosine-type recombinase/integrase [Allomuricauda olearia]